MRRSKSGRRSLSDSVSDISPALKYPNYRRWAAADFISVTGTWMQNLGLNWLVLSMTGSAGLLGLSLLFQTAPKVVFGSWAGSIADRVPANRVLMITQSAHALLALWLAFAAWHGSSLPVIYGIALLSGVISVFDGPALGRYASQLIPRETLGNALSLGSVLSSAARILGMSAAGVLVGVSGQGWLFAVNAVSFGAVIVALSRIRAPALFTLTKSPPERAGAMAGLRYVRDHRPLIVLFLLAFALSSLGRNFQVTMAAMADGPLDAGAEGYAVLSVVFAVGTILGGLVAAARPELTLRLLLGMALASGIAQALSGSASTLFVFAAALLPIAVGGVIVDTTMTARMQLDTAEEMRGRVLAAKSIVSAAAGAVGGPLLGWLCEVIGVGHALEIGGIVTALMTVVVWALFARMPERRALPYAQRWIRLADPEPQQPRTSTSEPAMA